MNGRRLKVLVIVAAAAAVAFGVWLVQHFQERHKAAEREVYYQTILTGCTSGLKPGMTRAQVEQYLQREGRQFRQMCCVANFKAEHVSLVDAGWDDLIKIGKEDAPWSAMRTTCTLPSSSILSHKANYLRRMAQTSLRECPSFIN